MDPCDPRRPREVPSCLKAFSAVQLWAATTSSWPLSLGGPAVRLRPLAAVELLAVALVLPLAAQDLVTHCLDSPAATTAAWRPEAALEVGPLGVLRLSPVLPLRMSVQLGPVQHLPTWERVLVLQAVVVALLAVLMLVVLLVSTLGVLLLDRNLVGTERALRSNNLLLCSSSSNPSMFRTGSSRSNNLIRLMLCTVVKRDIQAKHSLKDKRRSSSSNSQACTVPVALEAITSVTTSRATITSIS